MIDFDDSKAGHHALGLGGAWAMAVGGMIGGGIFSTLGVVIAVAGHWAWLSFLIGGAIAFCTGNSYAALTVELDEPGGSYSYLRSLNYVILARIAAWVLLIGYTLTVAVYAFTFGAYAANAFGIDAGWVPPFCAVAVIAILAGINLMGATEATIVELVAVWGKLVILLGLAGLGIWHWAPERLVLSHGHAVGFSGALIGTGVVFMAYEGFQLLAYDYHEMRDKERTISRAMPLAVVATMATYVLVALGAPMLAGAEQIVIHKEVALAEAGRDALGTFGFVAVTIAAVFSTASAINATVFATARLAAHAAGDNEMPRLFGLRNGQNVPWFGTVLIAVVAAFLAVIGGIDALVESASFVFLLVFALVNAIALRRKTGHHLLSTLGLIGSLAAAVMLVLYEFGIA
ncbi:APC family permease [Novosphingobium sp. ZN18A2]|uniref:APC family permease n=1 Tax=Novosphingobium sp. ZN18A2 TaxID=3079861 RepID=UPI0030CC8662